MVEGKYVVMKVSKTRALNRPRPMQQRSGGERDEGDKMRFLR